MAQAADMGGPASVRELLRRRRGSSARGSRPVSATSGTSAPFTPPDASLSVQTVPFEAAAMGSREQGGKRSQKPGAKHQHQRHPQAGSRLPRAAPDLSVGSAHMMPSRQPSEDPGERSPPKPGRRITDSKAGGGGGGRGGTSQGSSRGGSRPAATDTGGGPASAARREIDHLYRQHNPDRLADVEKLAAKYGEEKLLGMIRKKYGVKAGGEPGVEGAVRSASRSGDSRPRQQHSRRASTADQQQTAMVEPVGRQKQSSEPKASRERRSEKTGRRESREGRARAEHVAKAQVPAALADQAGQAETRLALQDTAELAAGLTAEQQRDQAWSAKMLLKESDTDDPLLRELLRRRREYKHEQSIETGGTNSFVEGRAAGLSLFDELGRRAREEAMMSLDASVCIKADLQRRSAKPASFAAANVGGSQDTCSLANGAATADAAMFSAELGGGGGVDGASGLEFAGRMSMASTAPRRVSLPNGDQLHRRKNRNGFRCFTH